MNPCFRNLKLQLVLWGLLGLVFLGTSGRGFMGCTRYGTAAGEASSVLTEDNEHDENFSGTRAFAYLNKQCAYGARVPGSLAHQETQAYLLSELQKFSHTVILQPFNFRHQNQIIQMNNILARFEGDGDRTVLLAAHWDTRPFADRDPTPANRVNPILGANDGASGVAVLLEVARVLKSKRPPSPVIIALFDGEDYGKTISEMFLGSRYFSKNVGNWNADFGILLDMVGDSDLGLPMEKNSWYANRRLTESIWGRAEEMKLPAFQQWLGAAVIDDHIQLIQAGIPTVAIIDFDYPYWHTVEDTPDRCSPESLGIVGELVLSVIYRGL